MFFGEYTISFYKEKNRLALPAKIRCQIKGGELVLSKGFDGCIFGYEKEEWEKSRRKELDVPVTEAKARQIRRYLFSGAAMIEYDNQGRTVIPQPLVDYASLDSDEVMVIGAGDHFEIWNKTEWQKYLKNTEKEIV